MQSFTEKIVAAALAAGFLSFAGAAMAADVKAPERIASAGKIVYCSDISGPPLGFFDFGRCPLDIDIFRFFCDFSHDGDFRGRNLGIAPEDGHMIGLITHAIAQFSDTEG